MLERIFGRKVDPLSQRVVKFNPSSPPHRGEYILVDDVRCRVTRCRTRSESVPEGTRWTILDLRVKGASS